MTSAKGNDAADKKLAEELQYRRESITAQRIRAREEQREREQELRRRALDDEAAFWSETAAVLGEDASIRAALVEAEATEEREVEEENWATWRRAQMDPDSQSFWDESVALGERVAIDPDGGLEQIVSDENAAIRRRRAMENGELELFGEDDK